MDRPGHLAALRRNGDDFAAAATGGDLTSPVAACPEWSLSDLLWHLAEVHHFWRTVVSQRWERPDAYVEPDRPSDAAELLAMYRTGLDALIATLTDTNPTTPVWTWSSDQSAGFVTRRMAYETAVHRWDAQQSAGVGPAPIEADLASDGIDEFLEHMAGAPRRAGTEPDPIGGSVHLHCTDVPGEWLIVEDDHGALHTTREHAKGDCAIRGQASNLLLALWRRVALTELEVIGDADVARRFIAHTRAD